MKAARSWLRGLVAIPAILLVACVDDASVTSPPVSPDGQAAVGQLPAQAQQRADWFATTSAEVLDLPQTVFADDDETTGQLVFGVENNGAGNAVRGVLARLGIPASAYRIQLAQPIHFMADLQDHFSSAVAGIQINFPGYLCTLGFNVLHSGGDSFVTASHCTTHQGGTEGTEYWQPLESTNPTVIAVEADDPSYKKASGCSRGKVCRRSDAARALYQSGIPHTLGAIAKPISMNNGSLDVSGNFTITAQEDAADHFSGRIDKVGRTTGWTSGTVSSTCATVNVLGSNIQLLCQTLVSSSTAKLVGPGDSGGPVFAPIVGSTTNVKLVGVLWGGSSSGDLFVFSPLKNIQQELGTVAATSGGTQPIDTGDGGNTGGGTGGCVTRGNSTKCK